MRWVGEGNRAPASSLPRLDTVTDHRLDRTVAPPHLHRLLHHPLCWGFTILSSPGGMPHWHFEHSDDEGEEAVLVCPPFAGGANTESGPPKEISDMRAVSPTVPIPGVRASGMRAMCTMGAGSSRSHAAAGGRRAKPHFLPRGPVDFVRWWVGGGWRGVAVSSQRRKLHGRAGESLPYRGGVDSTPSW